MGNKSFPPADLKGKCKDCGVEYIVTVAEQDFFKSIGHEFPRRCKACRKKKKRYGDVRGVSKRDDVTTKASATKNQINISSKEFGVISGDYTESRGSGYFMAQEEADKMNR